MIRYEAGLHFVGYGRYIVCPRCHNEVTEEVSCQFYETYALLYTLSSSHENPVVYCPICRTITAGQDHEAISEILDEGRVHTKRAWKANGYLARRKWMKDMRTLGFHKLADFVEREE
ncbi:hypothetical protein FBQ87_09505 [Sphingobacteriales bacterium CHB3]|nr:hypothetical protein [Sphingobacteriales bacterium CHB3]